MGSHLYWRLNITANDGDPSFLAVAEVEMRATLGGADQCSGGTASASATDGSSSAGHAVDNDPATRWLTLTGLESGWWQYHFASPVSVVEYTIQSHASIPSISPRNWTLLGSNDGVDWFLMDTRTGETGWTNGQIRTFELEASEPNLTGNNCSQVNLSASGTISSHHTLTGNSAAQPNTSTDGAIDLTLTLTGNNVHQPNTTVIGAISSEHTLAGANAAQPNTSTNGAVSAGGRPVGQNGFIAVVVVAG